MSKLFIPVLEGTTRPGRKSIHAAKLITEIGNKRDGIEAELVDPLDYNFPYDGNNKEVKDPRYGELTKKADAFFIVTPEYNHSYPGTLKRMLDSELKNYIHKPVAFAGVSGGMWGGIRAIEALAATVREMGMVAIFQDVQFPKVGKIFNEEGELQDENYIERVNKVYDELIWMAKTLKYGRENFPNKFHKTED